MNMLNAKTSPKPVDEGRYRPRPRGIRHGFKIVALIFAAGLALALARQSPRHDGLPEATATPAQIMTGIDYYPAQFASPAAREAPEQHIQAF